MKTDERLISSTCVSLATSASFFSFFLFLFRFILYNIYLLHPNLHREILRWDVAVEFPRSSPKSRG